MIKNKKSLIVLLFVLCFQFAVAQEEESESSLENNNSNVQLKTRKQEISFDDELVEGERRKPELFYLLQKKQYNFGKLIRLRENFLPEMRRNKEVIANGGME